MPDRLTVSDDGFAVALDSMLTSVLNSVDNGLPNAVRNSCKVGARKARQLAPVSKNDDAGTVHYKTGFTYKVDRQGKHKCMGEIGNRKKPGLVHLLEKGHRTIGGGWVGPSPAEGHIKPAAEVTFKRFEKEIDEVVEGAL